MYNYCKKADKMLPNTKIPINFNAKQHLRRNFCGAVKKTT